MEVYFIPETITQIELDEIYVQILNDYNEYKLTSMIFKEPIKRLN